MPDTAAGFTISLESPLQPGDALRRILDLRQHDRLIPLTRVNPAMAADDLAAGTEFVARTGIGRLGFDDRMRVQRIFMDDPDGGSGAVITKHARVIQGTIRLTITPTPTGSHIRWYQSVRLPWLPRFVQPAAAWVIRLGYLRVLTTLLATESEAVSSPPATAQRFSATPGTVLRRRAGR